MANRFLCIFIFFGIIFLQSLSSYYAHAEDPLPADTKVSAEKIPPSPDAEELITLRIPKDLLPADILKSAKNITPSPDAEGFITLRIPLFSPAYDSIPVALVDEDPVIMYDLSVALAQQQELESEQLGEREKGYLRTLNRLINSRLIVLEAINIGLNDTDEVRNQIEAFTIQTLQQELMKNHLQGLEPDPAEVEDLYRKMSREVKLYSLTFPAGPEARKFIEEVKKGDFDQLANRIVEEGKAKEQKDEAYVKIKDLRPEVGQEVYSMDVGGLSKIYRTEDGYLVYRLVDARFVEDPPVREEARNIVLETTKKEKALEYGIALRDKYVTFDEELFKQLDFDADFEQLQQDKRVLAKGKSKEYPFTITVADLAAQMKVSFFHGADKAQKLKMINERKDIAIGNMIYMYSSELEARHLGLDQTDTFKRKVKEYERSTIFSIFTNKVLMPEVKVTEEEIRAYYEKHIDEYSSPAMLRLKSLAFNNRQEAESALDKLRKGADFNWVSANVTGLVAPDAAGLLTLDKNLLSLTSLPEDLQESARDVNKGGTLLYAPSEGDFFYVLLVEDVFPPEPQPYEQARAEAAKKVLNLNIEKALDEWVTKLKEEYPVRIFLQDPGQ